MPKLNIQVLTVQNNAKAQHPGTHSTKHPELKTSSVERKPSIIFALRQVLLG
jgi:hypothetical protein